MVWQLGSGNRNCDKWPGSYRGVPGPATSGSIYYALPAGAQSANINGVQYYVANGVYYRPYFGSNGVYYQVAPNPV